MAEELFAVLARFHREIVMPDVRHVVREELRSEIGSLRNEMLNGFDAIEKRLGNMECEYQALKAAVKRLEDQMGAVELKLDRMALKSELIELKSQIAALEQRVVDLEARL